MRIPDLVERVLKESDAHRSLGLRTHVFMRIHDAEDSLPLGGRGAMIFLPHKQPGYFGEALAAEFFVDESLSPGTIRIESVENVDRG